ncbi:MAG: hypothetical protein P8X73_12670 [Ignavibacteriaceae bacterium]
MKIYDVPGSNSETLVNEEKPTGSYNVGFDGSDISSGIYVYCHTVGNFSVVEKKVLLKYRFL